MPPPTKWYLNLQREEEANSGTRIELVAKRKTFHKPGRTMRSVRWAVAKNFAELEESALPKGVGDLSHEVTREGQDRTFQNQLSTGVVTKMTYTVTARKDGQAGTGGTNVAFDKSYETWRRVYLDVVYMPGTRQHWDAVKARFKAAWAEVGYEMVENAVVAARRDEAQTDRSLAIEGPAHEAHMLKHLYTGDLAKAPYHVRMVICKDIVETSHDEVGWRMTNATNLRDGITRIWSEGNVVHYSSPIQLHAANPTEAVVRAIGSAAVPGAAIARPSEHLVTIDLNNGGLAAARDALAAGRKVSLKAKLKAAKSAPTSIKMDLDHRSKAAPIVLGSSTITVAQQVATWVITIQDPDHTWAAAPVRSAKLETRSRAKFGDSQWGGSVSTDIAGQVVRHDDHELRVTIPNVHDSHSLLDHQTEFVDSGVRKIRGARLELDLLWDAAASEEDVDAQIKDEPTAMYRYVAAGPRIEITDATRVFDGATPLIGAELLAAAADVPIPAGAIATANGNREVTFDLGHGTLAAPLGVFNGGGTLEFRAKLHAVTSIGGYSPGKDRFFVALTTKKLTPTQPDARTQLLLLGSALHEIGHAHSLVGSGLTYGGGERTNAKQYKDPHGGQGRHCSHAAKLAPSGPSYGRKPTSSGQVYIHDGGGEQLCIMYHDLDMDNSSFKFCDTCKHQLRLNALHKLEHTNAAEE